LSGQLGKRRRDSGHAWLGRPGTGGGGSSTPATA